MQQRNRDAAGRTTSVGILGGGTSGYLTALSMKRARPELEVSVIESSRIPVIGVGEATTSEIVPYLHRILGLDVHEFYRELKPTWKLGIKFVWGLPGDYSFNFPFDFPHPLESLLYEGHLRNTSLLSILMEQKKGLVVSRRDGAGHSLLSSSPYAYHLDNERYVRYLQNQADRAGILRLDREIVDAELSENGDIACLVASDSSRYAYDLYVDCSGFRSLLLEHKLGSKFISYADSLFTDRAVPADVPHGGVLKPYTRADSMLNGWCWNIPQVESDHCGYVFSSAFCSEEEAVAEMREKYPEMGEHRLIKFRSGRHEEFWKGNVIAVGNSYGFVEPLESTAIQMMLYENLAMVRYFPVQKSEQQNKPIVNRYVAGKWDYLRWFLGIHYRFNRKYDSPFWKHCREHTNIAGAEEALRMFQQGAPLSYGRLDEARRRAPRPAFDEFGYDMLLLGQGVPASFVKPLETREAYLGKLRGREWVARGALSHERSLDVLQAGEEDLLSAHIADDQSWVGVFEKDLRQ
ncbi:MAG TPA: tryptophan halogenase family protein, partial [Vicinamibacteria bacterium]